MTAKTQRESAKIYQFPQGGRAGLEAERTAWRQAQEPQPTVANIVFGSGWYHDEAVLEAQPVAKR